MCKLQFSSAPQSSPQGEQHDFQDEGYEENALEALLALAADNGMCGAFEYPSEAVAGSSGCAEDVLQYDGRASGHQAAPKDPSRYHCPFPGCKRSFQELWRLKVHYRAPPNIRGSGKERGHGMRLTHCPKCGAALKVGGHHVKCAAVPKEAAGSSNSAGRRNRKVAAAASRGEAADAAMEAAVAYAEPSYQYSSSGPAGTAAAAAAAAAPGQSPYQQYSLSNVMQQQTAQGQQSLWQKALQLHAHQQQYEEDCGQYNCQEENSTPYKSAFGHATTAAAAAAAEDAFLQRVPSSDDSSSSRMVEGTSSGGSGNDAQWGPSSSSGCGSGAEDMDMVQQQFAAAPEPLLSLFSTHTHTAATGTHSSMQPPPAVPAVKAEFLPEQQQQHPEAGQLLWQHMLLQHLQQHVAQTPGLSLPELIQVAAALFGNRVDTLVNAFGLSGPQAAAASVGQEQAHLAQLVTALRSTDTPTAAAGTPGYPSM